MENIKNNPQILAFINSQMQTGLSNQLNNEEQAKMIETLMKFQQFINNQNQNNLNNINNKEQNNISNIKNNNNNFVPFQMRISILIKLITFYKI